MQESPKRVWGKIAVFYLLTLTLSSFFYAATTWAPDNMAYWTGLMWCPALAAFATKIFYREGLAGLGWRWGAPRYRWLGYLLPFGYALPVYLVVWVTGLGGFFDREFLATTMTEYGWNLAPLPGLVAFTLILMTIQLIPAGARALGEEVGWRGFLVPELSKVTGFTGVALISGLLWAVWDYPLILLGFFLNTGTPVWYTATCLTIMLVALSFITAWLRLRSNSVWPAVLLHAGHNVLLQQILTPLTTDKGHTAYFIDEAGAGLAITTAVAAFVVWRKRGDLAAVAAAVREPGGLSGEGPG